MTYSTWDNHMPCTTVKFVDNSFARVLSMHIITINLLFTTIHGMTNAITCLMMNPGQALKSHDGVFSCRLIALRWDQTDCLSSRNSCRKTWLKAGARVTQCVNGSRLQVFSFNFVNSKQQRLRMPTSLKQYVRISFSKSKT